MTALMLLGPGTPMLFQGQEFAASSPFLYFADHNENLAPLIRRGRAEFLSQFSSIACSGNASHGFLTLAILKPSSARDSISLSATDIPRPTCYTVICYDCDVRIPP